MARARASKNHFDSEMVPNYSGPASGLRHSACPCVAAHRLRGVSASRNCAADSRASSFALMLAPGPRHGRSGTEGVWLYWASAVW